MRPWIRAVFGLLPICGFMLIGASLAQGQDSALDTAAPASGPAVVNLDPSYHPPVATEGNLLYDNGPLVNNPGGGVGGADESVLQNTTLGMQIFGFGHQAALNYTVADDFTVTDDSWTIDSLVFYAYQSFSGTTSTITAVHYQIWDGPPNAGGSVIYGDLTTNRMIRTTWSNIYRVTETTSGGNTDRPVMQNTVSGGVTLSSGTYWIEWNTDGTLSSGPWAPPITITGMSTTGNGLQNQAGSWLDLIDSGTLTPQGLPFLIYGTNGGDIFWDDFEAYTAGMQLALQNPTDWTTWSAMPGSGEDPFVSSNYAYSGSNSVVIAQNNDLVRLHDQRSSGTWGMSWQMYIPAGKAGYFNTLSDFNQPAGPYYWAMEVYFDAGGAGRLLTGDPQVDFTWTEDTWHQVEVIADLDQDSAQFVFDGQIIHEWQWTLGASGGTGPLELDANDLFGATANDEMYVDDYHFKPDSLRGVVIGPEPLMSLTHTPGNLNMGIFNDGSIGTDNVGFMGPGVTWNGTNGCFVGGPIFGTAGVGSVNGLIGSFTIFGDIVNVASNFAGGFTSDANFDQIASADLDDSGAAIPYGVDILQRSYSNTGEEVGFIRYGYVNNSGNDLTDFYAGIFLDWDVDDYTTNSGGYDVDRNLLYEFDGVGTDPYFGLVALDGLSGGRVTTESPAPDTRTGSFTYISTMDLTIGPNGDYRTWIGTGPIDIANGDTAWVTFAVVAGDDLSEIQDFADGAKAKAIAVGWIEATGVNDPTAEVPVQYDLAQNYPNPFNPSTRITYALPEQASVTLKVYNVLGQEVVTLADQVQEAGYHEVVWNARNTFGQPVGSGVYFYRLEAKGTNGENYTNLKKMLFLK